VLGPVFRTHDPDHERLVAVKAFTIDLTPEQASSLAAEFEQLTAHGIDNPCVAAPIAAGVESFVPYLAAPYVSGESLDAAIRQYGPAPAGDAIRLVAHVAEALDAASHAGVHHGSLHPRDIIVTPGETHVTGLGVAQALERVGLHGPVRRPYVAPERESGDEWGAAADIYALAAIAYEVLTGRRALPGTDQPLPGLDDLHVHDPSALRDVIESALDPDPARRPARASAFAAGFAAALSESAGAGAPGERGPERRARKPRTKPPKLPGLDEPLSGQEGPPKARARGVTPAVAAPPDTGVSAEGQGEATVPPAPPEVGAAISTIRYVPVTDPSDAGEMARELEALSASIPEVRLGPDGAAHGAQPEEAARPLGTELPPSRLATGLTPDLRLVDELVSRVDAPGETVDTELAAALDRLSSDQGAGPTPAIIGIDLLGRGPRAQSSDVDLSGGGVDFDLAAETQLGYYVADDRDGGPAQTAADGDPAPTARSEEPALDVSAFQRPAALPSVQTEAAAEAVDAAQPPAAGEPVEPVEPIEQSGAAPAAAARAESAEATEPLRPFARGRAGERRRPPSRYSRSETPLPEAGTPEQETGVPRAFEQARPTPSARAVPDFELLTRPAARRPPVGPVSMGLVVGLILGLAGGYWLGSRTAAPAPATQAAIAGRGAPAPVAAAESARPAAATPAAAPPVAAPAVPSGATPKADPVPGPSSPAPTVGSTPSRGLPAPVRGSISVTATPQANVYVDGERRGMTPRSLKDVPMGSHTVRVTRPGYDTQQQTVVLTAKEPAASMAFTLTPAGTAPQAGAPRAPAVKSVLTVVIESTPPGARIRIDGRDLAPTPLTVRQLRPGTHSIELRLAGYKVWSQRLTVAAGDNRRITATLERDNTR
jgi:hypothetical protein